MKAIGGVNARVLPKKEQKPAHEEAGFLLRAFPGERRYADLGYLLPFHLGLAVKNPVYRPFLSGTPSIIILPRPE